MASSLKNVDVKLRDTCICWGIIQRVHGRKDRASEVLLFEKGTANIVEDAPTENIDRRLLGEFLILFLPPEAEFTSTDASH